MNEVVQEPGAISRLIGVFSSPAKTFESIQRKPGWDWVLPVVLLAAVVFLVQSVVVPKIDVDEAVQAQMRLVEKMSGREMSGADRDKLEEQVKQSFEGQKSPVRRLLFMPLILIPIFLVPGIYHGLAAAFGTKTTYMRVVAAYAYTQAIQIVPQLLTAVVAWPKESLSANDVQFNRILKSNVGAFLDFDTTHKAILAVLSSVDVFDFWAFAVGAIALSRVTRFTPKAAALVVGGVWAAYILLKIVLAIVYQAFMFA